MKLVSKLLLCALLVINFETLLVSSFDPRSALNYAVQQYTSLSLQLDQDGPNSGFITTANPLNAFWDKTDVWRWTSGFYGGSLWTLYKLTSDNYWKDLAEEFQERVKERQFDTSTHDVGFVIMSTYGLCLEYTANENITVPVIDQTATSLASRFHRN